MQCFEVFFYSIEKVLFAHCKKSWRKTSPAWPDDAVLKYQGDGTLFRHADQDNPTSSYEEDGIFRGHWHSAKFSDNFPSTFRPFSVDFPTIFRQLSDKWIKSKLAKAGREPTSFMVTFFYSTTAPHLLSSHCMCSFINSLIPFFLHCFPSSILCLSSSLLCFPLLALWLPSSVLCFPSSVLFSWRKWIFYSNIFYSILPSSVLCFPSSILSIISYPFH